MTEIFVAEDNSFRYLIGLVGDHIGQGIVPVIVLAGLHLYGKDNTVLLNHKIQLALSLAVEIIEVEPVGRQLLCDGVLVNGAEIDAFGISEQSQLNAVGVLAGQQTDIVLEQLEQISRTGQLQRDDRLLHIIDRQCHTRLLQPNKAVFKT